MFERLLPRHMQIIYEINARLLRKAHIHWPGDSVRLRKMSIIEEEPERAVRMANLAVTGSTKVNGVAELHSELLRKNLFPDFAELWPDKFLNETNGVSPRRWLRIANPGLCRVFDRYLGNDWMTNLVSLKDLMKVGDASTLYEELSAVKHENKRRLADLAKQKAGVKIDPHSMYVVQVKRIHEYKRQILCCLHIMAQYLRLKDHPTADVVPATFVFAGKAAPGYAMAKQHIHLICDIASIVNEDPVIADRLRVVFMPNYSVTLAERIIPDASVPAREICRDTSAAGMMRSASVTL
jgi:starch phosphorylase